MCKKVLSLVMCGSIFLAGIPVISANAAEINKPKSSFELKSYEGLGTGKVINCHSLTVRKSISVSSTAIGWLQKGDIVTVLHSYETDDNPSWYCVSYTNSSGKYIRGYVKKHYIDFKD